MPTPSTCQAHLHPLDLLVMYDLIYVVWKLAERLKIERLHYLGYGSWAQLDDYTEEEMIAVWQRHLAKREPESRGRAMGLEHRRGEVV